MSFFLGSLAAELNSFSWLAPRLLLHAMWDLTRHFSSGDLNQIKSRETAFLKQPVSHKAETVVFKKGRDGWVRLDIGPYLLQVCWSLYFTCLFHSEFADEREYFPSRNEGSTLLQCLLLIFLTISNSWVSHQNLILYFHVLLIRCYAAKPWHCMS